MQEDEVTVLHVQITKKVLILVNDIIQLRFVKNNTMKWLDYAVYM